jgi:serine/threonine protein phosphatase PrpC
MKDADLPGLAMSRSLGDRVAQQCGVTAEPEVSQYDIKPEDKFMVIASDGVWEFLSNQ